jgi:hypothetical protein
MARIHIPYGVSGVTDLYCRFRDGDGKYRLGSTGAYETYSAVNIALYGADTGSGTPYHVVVEDGATGDYYVEIPDATARTWSAYLQAGAAPLESDVEVAADRIGLDATAAAQSQAAAAEAIAAAEPIDANATQLAGQPVNAAAPVTFPGSVASEATLGKIAPRLIGTLSGAGTGTEICVYGGTTVTYTVDGSGNITNVAFS